MTASQPQVIVRNGRYLRLSSLALLVLERLEAGDSSLEAARALSAQTGQLVTVEVVEAAFERLRTQLRQLDEATPPQMFGLSFRRTLISERTVLTLVRPLTRAFSQGFVWTVLGGTGLAGLGVALVAPSALDGLSQTPEPSAWLSGYLLFVASAFAHELGHAAACARYGARPSELGLTLYLIFPSFYSNVSSAWTLKPWQRVVVDVGGVWFQALVGVVFLLGWFWTGAAALHTALLYITAGVLFSLNPFLRQDGYWVVSDVLDVPNLGRQPMRLARHALARIRGQHPSPLPWSHATLICLGLYSVFSVFIWGQFFWHFGPRLVQAVVGIPRQLWVLLTFILAMDRNAIVTQVTQVGADLLLTLVGFSLVRQLWVAATAWYKERHAHGDTSNDSTQRASARREAESH